MAPTQHNKTNCSKDNAHDIDRTREGQIEHKNPATRPEKPNAAVANVRNHMADAKTAADASLNEGSLTGLLQGISAQEEKDTGPLDAAECLSVKAGAEKPGVPSPLVESFGAADVVDPEVANMVFLQPHGLLTLPSSLRTLLATGCHLRSHLRHHSTTQSSVNPTETAHFTHLASSWWDPHGSSRLLHLMNPLRHDFIARCQSVSPPAPNQRLSYLDIGCGGGIFAESAARSRGSESVVGIDPTEMCVKVAERHKRSDPALMEEGRLRYVTSAVEDLGKHLEEGTRQFDVVSMFEVVEHIQQPAPFLKQALSFLKPGGWLIGSTIARTPVSWFTTKFVAEDVLGMVPKGTHDWNQYINPQEMREWARKEPELDTSDGIGWRVMGVVYVPGVGWREVKGSESIGNYFFGARKRGVV